VWLLSIGFTLLFGSVMTKNWRVLRIFQCGVKLEQAMITNRQLIIILLSLLLFDLLLLSLYESHAQTCESPLIITLFQDHSLINLSFISIMCIYKASMLVYGVVIAVKSRVIEMEEFNERNQLGRKKREEKKKKRKAGDDVFLTACVLGICLGN
jgi:hypothetical protein